MSGRGEYNADCNLSVCYRGFFISVCFPATASAQRKRKQPASPVSSSSRNNPQNSPDKNARNALQQERDLYRKTIASIVLVETPCKNGTGFVVAKDLVMTNHHVAECDRGEGAVKLLVGQEHFAYTEKYLALNDIAILRVPGLAERPLVFADGNDAVKMGETVFIIGNPFGNEGFYSKGAIVRIRADGYLYFDAPVAPGSSGSPVLNVKGEVVGIETTGQLLGATIVGGAIPVRDLTEFQTRVARGEIKNSYDAFDYTNPALIVNKQSSRASHAAPLGDPILATVTAAPGQCTAEQVKAARIIFKQKPWWRRMPTVTGLVDLVFRLEIEKAGYVVGVTLISPETLDSKTGVIVGPATQAARVSTFAALGCDYQTEIRYRYTPSY